MLLFSVHKKIIQTAFFITGCFFMAGCENDDKVLQDWTKKVVMQEEAIQVESYLSQDGKLKAKLKAPLMIRVAGDTISVEFPNKLHCDFYDDSTQLETWLDSKYGIYYENLNKVYLRDSVVVITVKGDTLKSPDLWWDQSTKMFYTDKYATYHGVGKNIYGGKGMEATQDLKRIMFKETTGNLKVSENGFPQ
ncbi:MAG TPA: LPS export ABC transporter periplasmic protein LptC [Chitinophagaceae bacterium]|nr:LPS export ABC transporter periplasmic protein LptC [Chitinophagaceae bacterium]HQZ73356.1 LPS export ABC transporter periplasmic protein LptC [Chitinophagaceae bacterium]